ncbi:MAG: acyl-CoA dehydrogenase family protein [Deltaproteobacteria bacterium]|nr:acyl-CoA dehydrogenase family protein [Deltaproteobacteria bacterium]
MYVDLAPQQRALQAELRQYFTSILTPELQTELHGSEGGGPLYKQAIKKMGADGWLGIGWPKEYGGQGRSPIEQFIFFDEGERAGIPIPFLTLNTVGPTIMKFGTDAQKQQFLPAILRGEVYFAIGYSEPSAGTDLAALRTRAVRDGDDYVINGNKVFTSLADYADYIWLAARTDPNAPKHKGISIFLVPASAPGVKITPIWTVSGLKTNATYYEDVRVPASSLVGAENLGWRLITNQLNFERIALTTPGPLERLLNDVRRWTQATKLPDGRRVIDQEWVQVNLARVRAKLEFLRLMNWKVAWALTQRAVNPADSSAVKVFATEFFIEAYRRLSEVIGQRATLRGDSADAVLRGRIEYLSRAATILTFGGGTNEIQRDLIAMLGLGMPSATR